MLAAKMAEPQQVGVPASEASVLIGLLGAICLMFPTMPACLITFETTVEAFNWHVFSVFIFSKIPSAITTLYQVIKAKMMN